MTNKEILARAKTINYPCIYVPAGEIRPKRAKWSKQLRSTSPAQRDALLPKIACQQERFQHEQDQVKFQAQQNA
jgi:hypothetical protein